MPKKERKTLEQILIDYKVLSKDQIANALGQCQKTGKPLKEVLVSGGFLTNDQLYSYLAEQLDIPYVDLSTFIIHPDVLKEVPESLARKYNLFPLFKVKDTLTIAMLDPLDFHAKDALKRQIKIKIKPVMASPIKLESMIERYYGTSSSIEEALRDFDMSASCMPFCFI